MPGLNCSGSCMSKQPYHNLYVVILPSILVVETRDVIRSPDIRTFESCSEVRTQFQHPEVRIKY